jgi:hypothetical protein
MQQTEVKLPGNSDAQRGELSSLGKPVACPLQRYRESLQHDALQQSLELGRGWPYCRQNLIDRNQLVAAKPGAFSLRVALQSGAKFHFHCF